MYHRLGKKRGREIMKILEFIVLGIIFLPVAFIVMSFFDAMFDID